MSFSIVLMENTSPANYVTKSVTNIATATGVLRKGATVTDPVIEIESSLASDIIGRVNYARIELWHRYYYVTSIKMDINGLWLISMHVDVLMSYSAQIKLQNAVVARQERRRNMYLDDGWFMTYSRIDVNTVYFSNTSPFSAEEFVLVLAGS